MIFIRLDLEEESVIMNYLCKKEIGVLKENIHFHIVDSTHLEMAEKTNNAFVVLICCLNFPYTVGLTSLVEALAFGLPILSTDNPTFRLM